MKIILIEVTEREDGLMSIDFNNLSREDVTDKENKLANNIEKAFKYLCDKNLFGETIDYKELEQEKAR